MGLFTLNNHEKKQENNRENNHEKNHDRKFKLNQSLTMFSSH